ncbi:MAG TPA: hypothetical protein VF240_01270 [Pyrinomonadaceae bacterium]
MPHLKTPLRTFAGLSLLMGLSLILSSGCATSGGTPKPDGVFPEAVGKYKLVNVEDGRDAEYENEKNKGQRYQSWRAKYSDGANDIFYQVGSHKSAEEAANELGFLTRCFDSNRKLMSNNKIWDGIPLKDGSGKAVGAMAVCFSDKSETNRSYGNGGLGDYEYAFGLSNDNRTYTVKPLKENTALVAEFVKALPFNSGVDLSALDAFARAKAAKPPTYKEMFDTLPPVKLAAKPYLKGKVLVLERDTTELEQSTSVGNPTNYYVTETNRQAMLPSDIGSIVRVDCRRSRKVGTYTAGAGDALPAYGATCEVLVIDNTVPAVIARKTFANEDMADVQLVDTDKKGKVTLKEYILPKPISEIKDFVQALPAN